MSSNVSKIIKYNCIELKNKLQDYLVGKYIDDINYNNMGLCIKQKDINFIIQEEQKNDIDNKNNYELNHDDYYYYLLERYDNIAAKAKKYVINNNLFKSNIKIEPMPNYHLGYKKPDSLTYMLLSLFFKK